MTAYYAIHTLHRLRGLSQDSSRLKALFFLSRLGATHRTVDVSLPDGTAITLDVMAASFMPREFLIDNMYGHLPRFLPQRGQTVVDVGAHQGLFSIPAAKRVGSQGSVIAIEPCVDNLGLLRSNLNKNGLYNVVVVPCAAANFEGETDLFLTPLLSGGSSLFFSSDPESVARRDSVRIQARRLDHIMEETGTRKIDLIKIDAEGACLSILEGASKALAGYPRLVMEVEGGEEELLRVVEKLEAMGYHWFKRNSIVYAEASAGSGGDRPV